MLFAFIQLWERVYIGLFLDIEYLHLKFTKKGDNHVIKLYEKIRTKPTKYSIIP
jgi:hypothetical protein